MTMEEKDIRVCGILIGDCDVTTDCNIYNSLFIDCHFGVRWKNGRFWLVRLNHTNMIVTCGQN